MLTIVCALIFWAGRMIYQNVSNVASERQSPIYFVPKTVDKSIQFWQVMNQGVFTAAKEYNIEVKEIGTETETDVEGQIRLLENAIKEKPKAIILAASDYNRIVPTAQEIIRAGIKLITVDSDLNGGISSSFIATDNYEAGKKAGTAMRSLVGPEAKIVVLSFIKGSSTAIDREKGVRDSLKAYDGIHLSQTYFSDGSVEKAYLIAKNLLQNDASIDGVISLNEPTVAGAAKAIQEAGAASRVKLIGFDSSMDEVAYLEEGVLQATVVQKPFNMGYLAVKTAIEAYNGEKIERRIDTGSKVITKENMYESENQKLLIPFEEK